MHFVTPRWVLECLCSLATVIRTITEVRVNLDLVQIDSCFVFFYLQFIVPQRFTSK